MLLRVHYFEFFILFDLSYWVVDCRYPVPFIFIKNTLPAVLYIVICSFTIFAKFKILCIFLLYTKIRTMYGISKSQILQNNRSSFVGVMPHLTTSVILDTLLLPLVLLNLGLVSSKMFSSSMAMTTARSYVLALRIVQIKNLHPL